MKKVNSIQVMVPYISCINNCKFCISHINRISIDAKSVVLSKDLQSIFIDRLNFLYSNGCKNIVITGDNEPFMNRDFLSFFANVLQMLNCKFENIEIQTSGVLLDEGIISFLKNDLNVKLISISISSLDKKVNAEIMRINKELMYNFEKISSEIHKNGIQLRITIILTEWFDRYQDNMIVLIEDILSIFAPEQITFKVLKSIDMRSSTYDWIIRHSASDNTLKSILNFLDLNTSCVSIYYGIKIYKYQNVSIMFDYDCMQNQNANEYRYLILLPNGELREQWF